MNYPYTKDEFDNATGGYHPASLCCIENCPGCLDDDAHTANVPMSSLDRFSVALLTEEFDTGGDE